MSSTLKGSSGHTSKEGQSDSRPHPTATQSSPTTAHQPPSVHSHVAITRPHTPFGASFSPREEQLQGLLSQERQRSEQRRNNYNTLKEEHLRLQNEYLALQAEMKHVLEETVYFKDKKNAELEQLLQTIEEKSKSVD